MEVLAGLWNLKRDCGVRLVLFMGQNDRGRSRRRGRQSSGLLGRVPRQHRVLDRHQSRGDFHLRDFARLQSGVPPPVHPRRRVDDHLRFGASGLQHLHALGARLAGILAHAVSQRAHVVAQHALPAYMGFAGDYHLPAFIYHVSFPAAHS